MTLDEKKIILIHYPRKRRVKVIQSIDIKIALKTNRLRLIAKECLNTILISLSARVRQKIHVGKNLQLK